MVDTDRFAIIADIHGNIWALETVLEDIERRKVAQMINLGDSLFGPLAPVETADRLIASNMISISGNCDRVLHNPTSDEQEWLNYRYTIEQLQPQHFAWLKRLPNNFENAHFFCCHGTPTSDDQPLLEEITPHGVFLAASKTIETRLGRIQSSVVLGAHTHVPRVVSLPNGRLIVNPGSVGLPAYEHDTPHPHYMEAGSPHARYAILELHSNGWQVELIAVSYDWQAAANRAHQNGRDDYVHWLSHGRVS